MKSARIDHSNDTFAAIVATKSDTKLHDVTFKVGYSKFSANKVIVACRSSYWRLKFNESNCDTYEVQDTTESAFNNVLSYIYSGKLVITKGTTADLVIEIINLAERFKLTRLTEKVINALRVHQNGFWILYKMANDLNSKALLQKCMDFADCQPNSVIEDERFLQLTAEQIITLLQRSTFYCPEVELFKASHKWLMKNNKQHYKEVMECIRFENMSQSDIEEISKGNDYDLRQFIEEACTRKLKRSRISFRISAYNPQLQCITFRKSGRLQEFNIYVENQKTFKFPENNSLKYISENYDECIICFKLPIACKINRILLQLKNDIIHNHKLVTANSGEFCYFIEVSSDFTTWIQICNRISDCCYGNQYVYFRDEIVQYIRICGVDWTNNGRHYFWSWIEFIFESGLVGECLQCSFESQILKADNCLLTALTNVAEYKRGAQLFVCDAKVVGSSLLADVQLDDKYDNPCTMKFLSFAEDNYIDVVFSQQFNIDTIKLLLYDRDATNYDFKLYVSSTHRDVYFDIDNNVNRRRISNNWLLVAEKNNVSSWQTITFPAQAVAVVSIQCTTVRNKSIYKYFRVVHIECFSSQNVLLLK